MEPSLIAVPLAVTYVLKKLCSRPLDELGELLGDRVRLWRYRNQIAILEEAAVYAERKKLALRELPLKTLLPLLEGASAEESPSLRTLWARLLVNASVTGTSPAVSNVACEMLKSISGNDAKVLDTLYRAVMGHDGRSARRHWFQHGVSAPDFPFYLIERSELIATTGISAEEFELSFDSIGRFNVIECPERHNADGRSLPKDHYAFTRLGWRVITLLQEMPDEKVSKADQETSLNNP